MRVLHAPSIVLLCAEVVPAPCGPPFTCGHNICIHIRHVVNTHGASSLCHSSVELLNACLRLSVFVGHSSGSLPVHAARGALGCSYTLLCV